MDHARVLFTGYRTAFANRDLSRWLYSAHQCISDGKRRGVESIFCVVHIAQSPHMLRGICGDGGDHGRNGSGLYDVAAWRQLNSSVHYSPDDCTPSGVNGNEMSGNFTAIYAVVVLALVYLAVMGTTGKPRSTWLGAFSLRRNLASLFEQPSRPESTIDCLFGLRFLAMLWTVVGHTFLFLQSYVANGDAVKAALADQLGNQWIANFTLSVDIFFTMSGCLCAFNFLRSTTAAEAVGDGKNAEVYSAGYWLKFYAHRIVRLWPAYVFTMATVIVLSNLLPPTLKPVWRALDPAPACLRYGWQNLLFVNSLYDNVCLSWTWYLGTDFLFYAASPPLLLLFLRVDRRAACTALCAALIAASAWANWRVMAAGRFPPTPMLWRQPALFSADYVRHHLVHYIKPWHRVGPYLVGMVLGSVLAGRRTLTTALDERGQREIGRSEGRYLVCALVILCAVYGHYPAIQGWDWPVYHLLYGSTFRTAFSVAVAGLIHTCQHHPTSVVNRLLSHRALLPLSTLSYSVYLIHLVPVLLALFTETHGGVFTGVGPVLVVCALTLAACYAYGLACYLLVERPAMRLEKRLLVRAPDKDKSH